MALLETEETTKISLRFFLTTVGIVLLGLISYFYTANASQDFKIEQKADKEIVLALRLQLKENISEVKLNIKEVKSDNKEAHDLLFQKMDELKTILIQTSR